MFSSCYSRICGASCPQDVVRFFLCGHVICFSHVIIFLAFNHVEQKTSAFFIFLFSILHKILVNHIFLMIPEIEGEPGAYIMQTSTGNNVIVMHNGN
jgi:hypothetical protein